MKNRKLIILLPLLFSGVVLASCGSKEKATYTITFKQTGFDDVIRTVKEGENLTDIPTPNSKTGYTVIWNRSNFTNISQDMLVYAIANANTYTVTYCAPGCSVDGTTAEVTYDSECSNLNMSVEKEYATFIGWEYNDVIYTNKSIWNVASNVTLTAKFEEAEKVTVTFIDIDESSVIKNVFKGATLTDIPEPSKKTGYTVSWDRTDFTNLNEDITVHAVCTANSYVVTYDADGFDIDETTISLTYDSPCIGLDMTLSKDNADFIGWEYDGVIYTDESIWNVADNVTLIAKWVETEKPVITFINWDGTTISKTVSRGQTLTDIPTPKEKTGYIVSWDVDDFTNILKNMTVNATLVAKTYTITLDPNGGVINKNIISVTFDQPYVLETPVHEEYFFGCWKYNGEVIPSSGTWSIDDDSFELVAEWGESKWTDIL